MTAKHLLVGAALAAFTATGAAAVPSGISFDGYAGPAGSISFDGDNDGFDDVTFHTTAGSGIATGSLEYVQTYLWDGLLLGTQQGGVDLGVNFTNGATGSLGFAFAISAFGAFPNAVLFSVYDAANTLLASAYGDAFYHGGDAPEGRVDLGFAGVAAYATFDFLGTGNSADYFIDNFTGTYLAPSAGGVPEPETWMQMILGLGAVGALARARGRRTGTAFAA